MNNKGFTLIEVLAVIVILASLSAVAVVSVTSSLQRNEEKECQRQKEKIINAGKIYFSLNNATSVTVGTLIDREFIEERNVNRLNRNSQVTVNSNGYSFNGDCTS